MLPTTTLRYEKEQSDHHQQHINAQFQFLQAICPSYHPPTASKQRRQVPHRYDYENLYRC